VRTFTAIARLDLDETTIRFCQAQFDLLDKPLTAALTDAGLSSEGQRRAGDRLVDHRRLVE